MRYILAVISTCVLAFLAGCSPSSNPIGVMQLTPSNIRADRRAYDGAPPVIPHTRLGGSCTSCHNETGKEVPGKGFAPSNPHSKTAGFGAISNCVQCHVFRESTDQFVANDFQALHQDLRRGERIYDGAPPVIPHAVFMRENCLACHSGPSARPEIRCTHATRTNCTQCHISRMTAGDQIWP